MDLTYATIIILASMIFVLSAMVGYLYWQQTRITQNIQSLGMIINSLVNPPLETIEEEEKVVHVEPQVVDVPVVEEEEDEEEDDRVSVEHVTEPTAESDNVDVDGLQDKTAAQLRELLTQKGIPFGKRDSKSVLIELLKATA